MSPRGVPVVGLHERLFTAAEQLLVRKGPGALDSRSITSEAGCAKGVLHNHFGNLDAFLTAFAADRLRHVLDTAARLPGRAGEGDVTENLATTAVEAFGSSSMAIVGLLTARPQLQPLVQDALGVCANLQGLETAFAAYFAAEAELGRITPHAEPEFLALMFVGTLHHLVASGRSGVGDLGERVKKIATVLVGVDQA
ncbi:TetR/AcrR family transcriptional regulator [Actinopolymorpha pittospori]|uniref:AcrR family transcriptional regulator n=1 Tax=Actinopolymorpha pittospori TaxID=648752 RepID=A0A927N1D3_9ACTN|nr:TetR/AcrR family transcriptional regulator [Actinopolymorpha pittospori]MBE1609143.1 AcrR family transcriptional regulator [Actinopolymorpha pittospori]